MINHLRDCTGNTGSFLSRGDFIPIQNFVEQQGFDFYTDPVDQSDYVLNLLERELITCIQTPERNLSSQP
jgi:hypothetical protein